MAPGLLAQIKPEWRHCYRAHGTPAVGVIQAVSPSGSVARVRLDHVADSYIFVSHLEPVAVNVMLEPDLLSAA